MQWSDRLEACRVVVGLAASPAGAPFGAFDMSGPCGARLTVIASDGHDTDWEHVSVSTRRRIPNWTEMTFVKSLFWGNNECVVQFHPPQSEYVNNYSTCLHLWRWKKGDFPMPPSELVGVKDLVLRDAGCSSG